MQWLTILVLGNLVLVAPAAAADAPAPPVHPATTRPTTVPIDPTTPRGALKTLARALDQGDRDTILKLLWADTESEHHVAQATADLAHATAALRLAAVKVFGATPSRPLGVEQGATPQALARIDSAQVEIHDDHAIVRTPDQEGPPMTLILHDGTWHVPVSELSKDVEPADVEQNLRDVAAQTRLMRALTAEVLSGKYKTATDARQALDERILHSTMPELEPGTSRPATTRPDGD